MIVVTPGEVVAYAEEYETKGAVYLNHYKYLASSIGVALFDKSTHTAVVKPLREPPIPPQGSVVYCIVVAKGRRVYHLKCFATEKERKIADAKYQTSGVLPHFLADGELGIGDYVRGKVVSTYGPPLVVSVKGYTYGSVLSRCPHCGSLMKRRGMTLQCTKCGAEAKRKIAMGHYMM